jgi:hypothetical protein
MRSWYGQMSCPSHSSLHPSGTVYIWRTHKEAYNLEYLVPTVKHGVGCVVVWVACCWSHYYLHCRITARKYVDRLGNQAHPLIQMLFPNKDAVFQEDTAPIHTAGTVQWWFEDHEGEVQHLPWPAQSLNLNFSEPLLSVLMTRARNRFQLPTSVKQLEDVLQDEW